MVSSLSLATEKLARLQDHLLIHKVRHVQSGSQGQESLTAFSNYTKFHVKRLSEVGFLVADSS